MGGGDFLCFSKFMCILCVFESSFCPNLNQLDKYIYKGVGKDYQLLRLIQLITMLFVIPHILVLKHLNNLDITDCLPLNELNFFMFQENKCI